MAIGIQVVKFAMVNVYQAFTFYAITLAAATLANNHFFDYGQSGVEKTIAQLKAHNMDYVGGGRDLKEAQETLYKNIGGETFAFVNNGNIIITGVEAGAKLQIVDMTGRVVASCGGHTRCVPTTGMAKGVYVLRLINGDDVKTQKIVIR